MSTALIAREFNGFIIQQRQTDGYINATAMCKAFGKNVVDWLKTESTYELFGALAKRLNLNNYDLNHNSLKTRGWKRIQNAFPTLVFVKGGSPENGGGTWIHYKMSVPLAQWLSAEFALIVSDWVEEWLTTGKNPVIHQIPYHLQRYLANRQCIPYTHFSILAELTLYLIAPLESFNYTLPDNMLPDISEGLLFNRWLRAEKNFDTDTLPIYVHTYEDGRQVRARLYPIELLPDFIKHFHQVWLPHHAPDYFAERDHNALPLMPKLLTTRLTQSLTDLLKEHHIALSAQKVNKILLEMGLLEEKTRPSVTKGTKKYKVLTEQGLVYGKNVVNPRKPEETTPAYYTDTFTELLAKIFAWQTRH